MSNQNDEINGLLASPGKSELADLIRQAIGAGPDEPVQIYSPPHKSRMDGKEVSYFPLTLDDFERLRTLPRKRLIDLGLRPWEPHGVKELLLFPYEWYGLIPDGFMLVDIFGTHEAFKRGVTDDDCRYGVLAYGIEAPR